MPDATTDDLVTVDGRRDLPRRPRVHARAGPRLRAGVALAVFAGGSLGAPVRYEIGLALTPRPDSFPWSTFMINVSGAYALGLLMVFALERWPPTTYVRPFFGVGVGMLALLQLLGWSCCVQFADQPETWNRCAGRLQDAVGSNMWSCRTKSCAYFQ